MTLLAVVLLASLGPVRPALASAEADQASPPPGGWVPDRIAVPAIGLDAPVVRVRLEIVWVQSQPVGQYAVPDYFAAGWHDGSAGLGVAGNTVFGGHSDIYGEVFRRLSDLRIGDRIVVYGGERSFEYRVETKVILQEAGRPLAERVANARWIDPTADERLTLITCWPYPGNTHRLVVVARPVREAAGAVATRPAASTEPRPAGTYVVRRGDTLSALARRFGTTPAAIATASGLSDPDRLVVGQRLTLPPPVLASGLQPAPYGASGSKGLAMATRHPEDLTALGAAWWYVWGWCDEPGCVPMVRAMEPPPACPAELLVGNEPNAREPYGAPLAPAEAADRVAAIERACPNSRLVVGNVSADDWSTAGGWGSGREWLRQFLLEYPRAAGHPFAQALGVHCYSQAAARWCVDRLAEMRALYPGEMWVTEFGILDGDPSEFKVLLEYAAARFRRYAAYTNRQPHTGQPWEIETGTELIGADGRPTPAGQVYAGW